MIIACPACRTRYVVPDTAIGIDGRTVRCAKCKHSWFQDGPEADVAPPAPPAPPAAAPQGADKGEAGDGGGAAAADPPAAPADETGAPDAPGSDENAQEEAAAEPADPDARPSLNHWRAFEESRSADDSAQPAGATPSGEDESSPQPAPASPVAASDSASDPVPPEPPVPDPAPDTPAEEVAEESEREAGEYSPFEHEPPFRPRRNPLKLWTAAAVLFFVAASAAAVAVNYYGLPSWVPIERPTFGIERPQLQLDFPPEQQDLRTLPNGTEYFEVNGSVTNTGRSSARVPPILIVLRDEQDRIVYTWELAPPRSELAPGETIAIREAMVDVPRSASVVEIGWKPG